MILGHLQEHQKILTFMKILVSADLGFTMVIHENTVKFSLS